MKKLTPSDLIRLALDKKAVVTSAPKGRIPAAFLISMQFRMVMRYLDSGCYEYTPKLKVKHRISGGEMIKSKY